MFKLLPALLLATDLAHADTIVDGDSRNPSGLGAGASVHLAFSLDKDFSSTNTVTALNVCVMDAANHTGSFAGGDTAVVGLGANGFVIGSEIDTAPSTIDEEALADDEISNRIPTGPASRMA